LWREQIRIGIGSDRVDLVRLGRGWSPRVIETHSVEFSADPELSLWQSPVNALKQCLDSLKATRTSATCSIVMGNAWVRYQLMPWHEGLANEQEYTAYAALHMQTIYGNLADKWHITCGEVRYGSATLVCAIERELVDHLRRVVAEHGLPLHALRPFLSAAVMRWHRRISMRDYWFALIDGQRICLVNAAAGQPRLLRTQRFRSDTGEELNAMLRLESIGLNQSSAVLPVYAFCPEATPALLAEMKAAQVRVLDAASYLAPMQSNARFALALT